MNDYLRFRVLWDVLFIVDKGSMERDRGSGIVNLDFLRVVGVLESIE